MSDWWYPGQLARQDWYADRPPARADWPAPPEMQPDSPAPDYDVFERAAQRVRQAVKPEAGRQEYPGQIVRPVVDALGHVISDINAKGQQFVGAATQRADEMTPLQQGATSQTTDYDPAKTAIAGELPLLANMWGVGSMSAPKAALGAFGGSRMPAMGELAAPNIVRANRIDPVITKVDPAMYEDTLSGVKQRIALGDLNAGRTFTSEAKPFETSRPEDIPVGSHVLSLHGDRSGVGKLSQILGHPIEAQQIHGGADFINTQSPNAVWASEPAVSSAYQNKVNWLEGIQGSQGVYGLYGPMGVRSIDFQPATSRLALQGVRDNRGMLSKEAIATFDKNMRRQWGGPTAADPGKKVDWVAAPDWPGIENTAAATKYLENATGGLRNKFAKMLDRGEMMDEGLPNMSVIRHGFTSPEFENLPNYTYGRRVAKLDANPAAGGIEHPAFGKNIGGQSLGGWGFASPREVAFEDVVKTLQAQNKPVSDWDFYFGGRMPKTVPYQQEVTPRWIDANSAFGQQAGKMGELAALDKFSREGLLFSGGGDKKVGAAVLAGANARGVERAPPFYSATQRAVENAKLGKGTPEQWLGYLRNQPGVKGEEVDRLFGNLPSEGMLTKADMQAHAAENAVTLGEVNKGGNISDAKVKEYHDISNSVWNRASEEQRTELRNEFLRNEGLTEGASPTKYSQWQLPGGENYREKLLTLPGPEWKPPGDEGRVFRSSHWDEPNVLAHIRMNDREVPGVGKSLHLEEIQSDWHQKGRQQGYSRQGSPEEIAAAQKELTDATNRMTSGPPRGPEAAANEQAYMAANNRLGLLTGVHSGVPDAPFKTTWPDVALKRSIRDAAEGGYDALSWTPGEAQAARYDLSKHIDSINYHADNQHLVAIDIRGNKAIDERVPPEKIADHIGKEAADKLLNSKPEGMLPIHRLYNADLKVGGEGMKAFYDKMLVDKANALGKKHGARVEQASVPVKKLNEDALSNLSPEDRTRLLEKYNAAQKHEPVHVLRITPQLREAAMKGFPLFSAGGGAVMGGLAAQDNYE